MPAFQLDLTPPAPPPAHALASTDEHLLASVWPEPETTHFKQRAIPRQLLYSLGTHDLQLRLLSPRGCGSGYRLCGTVYGDCAGGVVSWWPLALGPTTAALDIDLAGPDAAPDWGPRRRWPRRRWPACPLARRACSCWKCPAAAACCAFGWPTSCWSWRRWA
jgi:hypothetical protein